MLSVSESPPISLTLPCYLVTAAGKLTRIQRQITTIVEVGCQGNEKTGHFCRVSVRPVLGLGGTPDICPPFWDNGSYFSRCDVLDKRQSIRNVHEHKTRGNDTGEMD